jgi:hypothetical protein
MLVFVEEHGCENHVGTTRNEDQEERLLFVLQAAFHVRMAGTFPYNSAVFEQLDDLHPKMKATPKLVSVASAYVLTLGIIIGIPKDNDGR